MISAPSDIISILKNVMDPEVPVLSIVDLGIVRNVNADGRSIKVTITPTYSGCPAMNTIAAEIKETLLAEGFLQIEIITVLSPAWTTDWMSEEGRQKLKAYGIAPPHPVQTVCHIGLFQAEEAIECPQCNSYNTRLVSQFGSTACKALYQCNDCREPFDYFKCH